MTGVQGETFRLESFLNAPDAILQALPATRAELAESGYYFDEDRQRVQCFYCRSAPMKPHDNCKWKRCNIPRHMQTDHFPAMLQEDHLRVTMGARLRTQPTLPQRSIRNQDPPPAGRGAVVGRRMAGYNDHGARLESLHINCTSGVDTDQNLDIIAEAGFFAVDSNTLQCHYCGVQAPRTTFTINANHQRTGRFHTRLNPTCLLARQFLIDVQVEQLRWQTEDVDPTNKKALMGSQGAAASAQTDQSTTQERTRGICMICMDSHATMVFLSCGHIVTCSPCGWSQRMCPDCQQLIRGRRSVLPQ